MTLSPKSQLPIGERLRMRRIEVLGKGLRETAALLDIAPAHLTDLEKGRRTPSVELLLRMANIYRVDEAELRSGWSRPEGVVAEVASQSPVTAEKVPEFLRQARNLSADQWDRLIKQAKKMSSDDSGEQRP